MIPPLPPTALAISQTGSKYDGLAYLILMIFLIILVFKSKKGDK